MRPRGDAVADWVGHGDIPSAALDPGCWHGADNVSDTQASIRTDKGYVMQKWKCWVPRLIRRLKKASETRGMEEGSSAVSDGHRLQFAGVIEDQAHGGAGQLRLRCVAQPIRQQGIHDAVWR